MALRHRWARAGAPHCGEMVGLVLGLEWIWRDHPHERRWGAIHFSPESTPHRRRNPLEGHLQTTALCTRCSGWHHSMRRARRPVKLVALANIRNIRVWSSRDRSPCSSRRRRNSGQTRGSMEHNGNKKHWVKHGNKTEGRRRDNCIWLVLLSQFTREARRRGIHTMEVFNFQKIDRDHRQRRHSRTNKH